MSISRNTVPRSRYHHGDLRNALAEAALELAREGGPEAVVLREAARRVGVSATAAYRYFAGQPDLLVEVRNQALGILAGTMAKALEGCEKVADPGELAVARLRSAAHAYLRFSFAEPGLFAAAFHDHGSTGRPDSAHPDFSQTEVFAALVQVLDELVAAGRMPPERRPYAEVAAWTAIHGVAVLFLHGPLCHLPEADRDAAVNHAVETTIRGLTG